MAADACCVMKVAALFLRNLLLSIIGIAYGDEYHRDMSGGWGAAAR